MAAGCVVAWLLVAGQPPRAQDSILGPIGGTTPFGAPVDVPTPALLAAAEPLPPPPAAMQRPDMTAPQRPDTTVPPLVPSPALQVPGLALDTRSEPLTLAEVLLSVLMHYPLLQAVERERGIAAGRLTTAMGAFDTNVNMAGNSLAPGTYENYAGPGPARRRAGRAHDRAEPARLHAVGGPHLLGLDGQR